MKLTTKYLLVFCLFFGALFGAVFWVVYQSLNTEYITIMLKDNSNCLNPKFSIISKDITFTVSDSQLSKSYNKSEALIHALIEPNNLGEIEYSVLAEFKNCSSIESTKRKVRKGYLLYEYIESGSIKFEIRSK